MTDRPRDTPGTGMYRGTPFTPPGGASPPEPEPPPLLPGEPIPAATINWQQRKMAERAQEVIEESWRDRLAFDFDVSDASPVIRGTWVTAAHIVSCILDGYTWCDILRDHPELTEDDVRVAVAYAVGEDDKGAAH